MSCLALKQPRKRDLHWRRLQECRRRVERRRLQRCKPSQREEWCLSYALTPAGAFSAAIAYWRRPKRCELDRLYQRISDDLDALLRDIGLKVAA